MLEEYESMGLRADARVLAARASLGWTLKRNGEFARAEPILRGVLEQTSEAVGERDPRALSARSTYADLLIDLKRYGEAEAAFRNLVADEGPGGPAEDRVLLGLSLHNLARTLFLQARPAEALEVADRALEVAGEVFGADHPQTLVILGTRASCLTSTGDLQQAARAYERILETGPAAWGETHEALRHAHTNLAILCNRLGRNEEMVEHQRAALEQAEQIYGEPSNRYCLRALTDLAAGLMEVGRRAEARPMFEEALAMLERHFGPEDELTVQTRINYALLVRHEGDEEDAIEILGPTLETCREHLPLGSQLTLQALFELGSIYLRRGELERAEPLLEEALDGWREHHRQVPGAGQRTVYQLTQIYLQLDRLDEAASLLREEFELGVPADATASGVFRMLVDRLGEVETRRGDLDAGEEQDLRLLRIGQSQGARGREAVARARNRLGRIQLAREDPMAAEDSFRAAIEADPGNPEYVADLESLLGEGASDPVEAAARPGEQ